MDVELLTIQQSTWSRRSWYQGVFWLQRGCSRALVQIFVAGRGDFGEHSRAPALLNTPLVQSVFKCVKIICWGGNTMKRELIFGSTYNFMETQIIVPFCFWIENLPDFWIMYCFSVIHIINQFIVCIHIR